MTQPPPQLSDRETECLRWISVGKTAAEVGVILSLSERTVNMHLTNARQKLGANNTTHAVAVAIRLGLIAP
ncbi:MAG: helix-turn-helix domain-containing protein [Burkholderiales bacterium]|nr:helix-turn-helix domain-containing protein [Burkholderiales bacterium]